MEKELIEAGHAKTAKAYILYREKKNFLRKTKEDMKNEFVIHGGKIKKDKYGDFQYDYPYFQNFVNSKLNPQDVRSMCYRLQLNLHKLRNKTGGIFGVGESTSSVGVVTINLTRIGYFAKDKKDFFNKLDRLLLPVSESLKIKKEIVQKNIDNGFLPYTKR